MCTETFLHLPEEKRNRFLEASWEEFTQVSFEKASINKIVLKARIPRGSFYQYFSGKDDLFSYLQEMVLKHLMSEYCSIMREAGGDMFQTQMLCYDRVASFGSTADPLFDRCIRILRLNPTLLPQAIAEGQLPCRMLETVWDLLDRSAFCQQEKEYVAQVFVMSLVPLAVAVMACLTVPENAEQYRQGLLLQLDVLKYGCLADPDRERG